MVGGTPALAGRLAWQGNAGLGMPGAGARDDAVRDTAPAVLGDGEQQAAGPRSGSGVTERMIAKPEPVTGIPFVPVR